MSITLADPTFTGVELVPEPTYSELEVELAELLAGREDLRRIAEGCVAPPLDKVWRMQEGKGILHYPQGIHPIQSVAHWRKVKAMVRGVERDGAGNIPPILVDGDTQVTGTHRWVANELLARRGRTEERIRVADLRNFPSLVQWTIRLTFAAQRFSSLQSLYHVMAGLPMSQGEVRMLKRVAPALIGCCTWNGEIA